MCAMKLGLSLSHLTSTDRKRNISISRLKGEKPIVLVILLELKVKIMLHEILSINML